MTAPVEVIRLNEETTSQSVADLETFNSQKIGTDLTFKRKIVWFNAIGFLILHIAALYGYYLARTSAYAYTSLFAIVTGLAASEGVKAGAHRLYSHRSYKAKPLLKLILIALQTVAGQNCLYIWVRDHRQHHKYSDTDADPHNATRGFFFSHMGWLMSKKHPLVIKMGKTIDMSDLEKDKLVMFQMKYYVPLYLVLAMIVPITIPVYFWNETWYNSFFISYCTRYVTLLNGTWCVNSWAHFFGTRPYNKNILPVETYFVGYVTLGEGWHNYHHAFPWDYKASELGAPGNFTRILIDFCASLGLAYDLKTASDSMIEKRTIDYGDGSAPTYSFLKDKILDKANAQADANKNNVDDGNLTVEQFSKKYTSVNNANRLVSARA